VPVPERRHLRRAAAVAALVLALSGCGTLDRDAVSTEVDRIGSVSAEGMLLAREAAHGRAFRGFVEIHSAELASQAQKALEKLQNVPAERGLGQAAASAIGFAGQVQDQLDQLHQHPTDRKQAAQVEHELSQISNKVNQLSSKL
jgi:homoserine kinase